MNRDVFGTLAAFPSEESYLAALRALGRAGYMEIETFTPYPVEAEEEALPRPPSPVGWVMLAAAIAGGGGGFFLQWYAARDYPLNVGGRPIDSWPSFIPVTFELTVLSAALAGVAALLWLAGLPRLDHPVFAEPGFARATSDQFFVCLLAGGRGYSETAARDALLRLGPVSVEEVFR
jgi:hypothetical protein